MIRAFFRHAFRRASRHPVYSAISIAGLSLGPAASLLILLFVVDELSFDRVHHDVESVYRVEMEVPRSAGPKRWAHSYVPVAELISEHLPMVESSVRIRPERSPLVGRPDTEIHFREDLVLGTEPEFFEVFDFPILAGSAESLSEPNTALISEHAARRYFGDEDPLGQSIEVFDGWSSQRTRYEVVGLIADMPQNVHVRSDFLLSLETSLAPDRERAWVMLAYSYVRLQPGADPAALATGLSETIDPLVQAQSPETRTLLQPLTRIHLHGAAERDIAPQGDIRYVWLFSAIALLILLIACFNYVNLATAQGVRRSREVGVRKAVGAGERQLVLQFVGESLLMAVAAVGFGVIVVQWSLPAFNALMGRSFALDLGDAATWFALVGMAVGVGVLAGAYPAWVLSRFKPARVLKGERTGLAPSRLRGALIVFQFAVSSVLIVATVVIQRQLAYVQHSRLGFDQEQVMVLRTRAALPESGAEAFGRALEAIPGVVEVGAGSSIPGEPTAISFFASEHIEDFEGEAPVFDHFWVTTDYAEALGLNVVEGRFFDPARPADPENALIINQAAARALGWTDPLGKMMGRPPDQRAVVGVVEDFHYQDMRSAIGPVVMEMKESERRYFLVRWTGTETSAMIGQMQAVWDRFIPEHPFDYSFMDDDLAAMYRAERRLGGLFTLFALLAIGIASLGLFGLTAYMVQQRTREIGIRKVLGASMQSLLVLLSREFAVLVLVAFVLALPLAWWIMSRWLQGFAYRTDLDWTVFAVAGLISAAVSGVAVLAHLVRAARADPAISLRTE